MLTPDTQPSGDTGAKPRVLLAGLVHQTNTFAAGQTGLGDFEVRRGQEMLHVEIAASSIAGVLVVAQD